MKPCRAEELREDLVMLADELRDEVDPKGIGIEVWRAIETLRRVRFAASVQRGQQAVARAISA